MISWNYVAFLLGWAANSRELAQQRARAFRTSGMCWGKDARRAMLRERRQIVARIWWCLLRASFYVNVRGGAPTSTVPIAESLRALRAKLTTSPLRGGAA